MTQLSRREHLVDTALGLFQESGFHSTGIDRILNEAGVSKKTMYQHFHSKEELIYAALRKYDSTFRNYYMNMIEKSGRTPRERLMAMFDITDEWMHSDRFYGCIFINAMGEYAQEDQTIRNICKDFKHMLWRYIYKLSKEAGADNPNGLANELHLLIEGAIVTAHVSQNVGAGEIAKRIGERCIAAYLDGDKKQDSR
ncbi:TetR family transcriptional regulator [Planctomycetota bacterium]|nr:TetR family transcriptional regulator [Planctomycetota bacterium]